jgi:hypothetical protein
MPKEQSNTKKSQLLEREKDAHMQNVHWSKQLKGDQNKLYCPNEHSLTIRQPAKVWIKINLANTSYVSDAW